MLTENNVYITKDISGETMRHNNFIEEIKYTAK